MKKILFFLIIVNFSFLILNCSRRYEPEPLQLSVKQNLALLQSEPQFVMYLNFKKMRETDFWKKFISDSIFASERNFGSFLNTLKTATGASISNGIDELYFSNSWIGDNAMVIKGTFDKNKINDYVKTDTNYTVIPYPNNIGVYNNQALHFYFYFRDDFTICASNYLNQIENTLKVTDTSSSGLLTNKNALDAIESIKYKENLWMMSNQKTFIRGIFENLSRMNKKGNNEIPGGEPGDSSSVTDTTKGGFDLASLYNKINAVSFSVKMSDAISLAMQNNCEDEQSATELKTRVEAMVALAKLSAQFSKTKSLAIIKLLDKIDINEYGKILFLETKIEPQQIEEIRKQKVF
ncbi:MAG: hypothetical protein ACHQJ4_01195 [Ignavibacteria bacterium]